MLVGAPDGRISAPNAERYSQKRTNSRSWTTHMHGTLFSAREGIYADVERTHTSSLDRQVQ